MISMMPCGVTRRTSQKPSRLVTSASGSSASEVAKPFGRELAEREIGHDLQPR